MKEHRLCGLAQQVSTQHRHAIPMHYERLLGLRQCCAATMCAVQSLATMLHMIVTDSVLTALVSVELKCRFCPKMPATIDTKANITVIITTICT